ncbi:plasmid partitioning protein RepB [Sagittula sp. S175]|uniref:plasmid partitioning protein RepB n=1 Tax=Sagittula sp. S175 TaxID=3415129 RepID=UPI003C7BF6F0
MARKAKLNPALSTLYNAPDVRENRRLRGGIAEVDPSEIDTDGRLEDRLALEVEDLKQSIEKNGQRVPILLRPVGERYALIYGRRRLEACRQLGLKVRAIVTDLDDGQSLRDQLIENQARRDLSFIERALVAAALLDGDHLAGNERTNRGVADILNLTEAGVSQMLSVVRVVGQPLIQAIGAAPGIGRPRWEELKRAVANGQADDLLDAAAQVDTLGLSGSEASDTVFLAVLGVAQERSGGDTASPAPPREKRPDARQVIKGVGTAQVKTSAKRLTLDLRAEDKNFIGWLEANAPALLSELHGRWTRSLEETTTEREH